MWIEFGKFGDHTLPVWILPVDLHPAEPALDLCRRIPAGAGFPQPVGPFCQFIKGRKDYS
jgi:hypothetical protein